VAQWPLGCRERAAPSEETVLGQFRPSICREWPDIATLSTGKSTRQYDQHGAMQYTQYTVRSPTSVRTNERAELAPMAMPAAFG
jgi:hypothetical protein